MLDYLSDDFVLGNKELVSVLNLKLKTLFYLTIFGNEIGLSLYNVLNNDKSFSEDEIIDFYKLLEEDIMNVVFTFSFKLVNEFYLLDKEYDNGERRCSIISIVDTDIIDSVYFMLRDKYEIELEMSFSKIHLTIYKQDENMGIELNKEGDLKKYSIKNSNSVEGLPN